MSHAAAFISGAVIFFVIVAAISRLATIPDAPKWITNAANAISHLFNGAFGL